MRRLTTKSRFDRAACCGALSVGVLAAAAIAAAPSAQASCASFFGLGNTAECSSTPTTYAIALGTNATAYATGLFGSAIAIGNGAEAVSTGGIFGTALAVGSNSGARAYGSLALAVWQGDSQQDLFAEPGGIARAGSSSNDFANVAISLANGTQSAPLISRNVIAAGGGSLAVSLFGGSSSSYEVSAVGSVSTAVQIGGNGNAITAGPGPFAIAVGLGQNNAVINKSGPGFNINGVVVGGAAATNGKKPASASSAKSSSNARGSSTGGSGRTSR